MTFLDDPLFKAALDAAFPRVILFADASPVRVISYNASAAALLKGEVIPIPGLHDFVEARYHDQHTERVIQEAVELAINTGERALLFYKYGC